MIGSARIPVHFIGGPFDGDKGIVPVYGADDGMPSVFLSETDRETTSGKPILNASSHDFDGATHYKAIARCSCGRWHLMLASLVRWELDARAR